MILSAERLHSFAVFAEDQNLSRAAKRLHLSQPAVHAQLKALSEELGVVLYQRVGRGLALTRDGVEVAAFARDMEERTDDLLRRLHDDRAAPGQRLVLAAGAGALVHLLAKGLRAFRRSSASSRPRVEVITADTNHALGLVRGGLAHVGVGVIDDPPSDLECQTLTRASQVVVAPRAHKFARKRVVSLIDLAGEDLVAPPEGGPQRAALDAAFAMKGLTLRASAIARGWDVVLKLVELGVGVGVINDTCTIPSALIARPIRELPTVTYRAFTRRSPRAITALLVSSLVTGAHT